ncbi:hypothetical protein BC941DRAFT_515403 [Chlamydoabsidia padenii]|nr:hypothetical protein BC941DRAFT_515403 [Chlamydoabsidia padenii]
MNGLLSFSRAKSSMDKVESGDRRRRSMAFTNILPLIYSRGSTSMNPCTSDGMMTTASLPAKSSTFFKQPSFSMMEEPTYRPRSTLSSSTTISSSTVMFDQSHLQPGRHTSLLSQADTIHMYQQNCKKTHHPDMICDFALFLIEAASALSENDPNRHQYLRRAEKLLKQLAARGHPAPQYHLGTLYTLGLLNRKKGKQQFAKAFPYFLQSAKLYHKDACFRVAKCYEDGLGCSKDLKKAGQYYATSAMLYHPGGMFRLGVAKLHGDLGLGIDQQEGIQWLQRSMEVATTDYPHALHELGLLHEHGRVVLMDLGYALHLYAQAADQLGYSPSAYRLGECYEHGQLGCDVDYSLAIHYYTMAAHTGHAEASFALAAWYLVGVPSVLPVSEYDAYVWAKQAALRGCVKAEFAMGYFNQVGVGCSIDRDAAKVWYNKAAQHGDPCAIHRLQRAPIGLSLPSLKSVKARDAMSYQQPPNNGGYYSQPPMSGYPQQQQQPQPGYYQQPSYYQPSPPPQTYIIQQQPQQHQDDGCCGSFCLGLACCCCIEECCL